MPQMFDWIFYAIVILPVAFLTADWLRTNSRHTGTTFGSESFTTPTHLNS